MGGSVCLMMMMMVDKDQYIALDKTMALIITSIITIITRWVWWVALFAYSAFILAAFAANLLIIN